MCAGYGGIDLGLRRVLPECRTIAYVEIEAFAIQNLVDKIEAQQLDAAPVHTNIKTFPFRQFRGCVDILSGGFPCQPFSQAGKKKGVEDERHLWPFIERGIEQCRPSAVFFENVNGIISTKTGNGDSVLKYVLTSLEQLGYRATAGVFSAEEIGAPHQRKRVFIMGYSEHKRFKPSQHEARKKRSATRYRMGSSARASNQLADTDNNRYRQNTTRQEKKGGVSQEHWQEVCGGMPHRTGQQHNSELADSTNLGCGGRISSGKHQRDRSVLSEEHQRTELVSQTEGCRGKSGEQCDSQLADTSGKGLQGSKFAGALPEETTTQHAASECYNAQWPSRPNEPQYEWEEPRVFETQSELGGAIDGFAGGVDTNQNRTDRLRLLGNGVVPGVAEKAFRVLWERLV